MLYIMLQFLSLRMAVMCSLGPGLDAVSSVLAASDGCQRWSAARPKGQGCVVCWCDGM
jgi:hypothetical protein